LVSIQAPTFLTTLTICCLFRRRNKKLPQMRWKVYSKTRRASNLAAESFQSFCSHTDGKIRDGHGEDGCGRKMEGTDPAFALSVIRDIPRCDGVGKPLKKTHTWSGGTGVRTLDLAHVKWRARRLATVLGPKYRCNILSPRPPYSLWCFHSILLMRTRSTRMLSRQRGRTSGSRAPQNLTIRRCSIPPPISLITAK
jgi:hypothetical protein